MYVLKHRPLKAQLAGLLVLTVAWILIIYLLLPVLGMKTLEVHSAVFLSLLFLFSVSGIYFFFYSSKKIHAGVADKLHKTQDTVYRHEAISAASDSAIWDLNLATNEVFYNDYLISLFGYAPSELTNNTRWWEANIHPDDHYRVLWTISQALSENNNTTVWQDEYRFLHKSGSYRYVKDCCFILRDNTGKPIRLMGSMTDITTLKKSEEQKLQKEISLRNEMGRIIVEAHEKEKLQIRETLHEDVNQVLASLKLQIHQLSGEKQPAHTIQNSLVVLADAMEKIKKLSNELTPGSFEYFGLMASVNDLMAELKNQYQKSVRFDAVDFNEDKIGKNKKMLLYRILHSKLNMLAKNHEVDSIFFRLQNPVLETKLFISFTVKTPCKEDTVKAILEDLYLRDIESKLAVYNGKILIGQEEKENKIEITIYPEEKMLMH